MYECVERFEHILGLMGRNHAFSLTFMPLIVLLLQLIHSQAAPSIIG